MKWLVPSVVLVVICALAWALAPAQAEHATLPWKEVAAYARENFPQEGVLQVTHDGYTYLKVDDRYVQALYPQLGLEEKGFKMAPVFRRKDAPGAHISVFYKDEHVKPEEIGQTFHFTINRIRIVRPSKRVSWAVLEVESPELEALRQKYGKSPLLHGFEFHISLAKKENR